MESYLHIKTSFDCLLKFCKTEKVLYKNKIYSFMLFDDVPLSFYPLGDEDLDSLPFSCSLTNSDGFLLTHRNNITVTEFPNKNYLLEVNPFIFSPSRSKFNLKSKKVSFNNITHTISWFNNAPLSCRIENDNSYLDFASPQNVIDMNYKAKKENIVMYFNTDKDTFIVCSATQKDNKYSLTELYEAEIVEESKDSISAYKNVLDFAGHGEIITYSFENDFKRTSALAYNLEKPKITKIREFIPFAFFEAIKIKNFKLARIYLSKTLSNKLSDKHLELFFGDFIKVHQTLSPSYSPEEVALIYNGEINQTAKIFNLKFNDENLIDNIEEK